MSKPVCPHEPATGNCPAIEDASHKAQYLHRCPYGHPCPKIHMSAHCADFYHHHQPAHPQQHQQSQTVSVNGQLYYPMPSSVSSSTQQIQPYMQQHQFPPHPSFPMMQQPSSMSSSSAMPSTPGGYVTVPAPQPGQQVVVMAPQQQFSGYYSHVSPYGPAPVQLPPAQPVPFPYAPVNAVMSAAPVPGLQLQQQQGQHQQQPYTVAPPRPQPRRGGAPQLQPAKELPFPTLQKLPPPK